jgi:EAL domain-containing protein (putative c-di-GMP-specific phosphodiesterase class I)
VDLCVNLSARQLLDPLVLEAVEDALRHSGLDAHRVVFEITESSLIEEGQATLDQLARLRAIGIRLAIDDFGTGYSSLGYLEQLPVDILKIDRAFIVDLPTSPKRATLLRAIVGMANALHLTTIAEGIETDEQMHAVRAIGCDLAQGFLISHPMEPHEAAVLIEAAAADPGLYRGLLRAADIAGRARDAAHHVQA